ncbi:uncharacterized protein [Ptychodera flava]|uniref:uncharacterized protein n=1 Tax=Ptychodera flava TaxID=63121 RepID=UPI00396A549C
MEQTIDYFLGNRRQLLRQGLCNDENLPGVCTISKILRDDLNYSFKRIQNVAREQQTERNLQRIFEYIDAMSQLNPQTVHFFDDETGVKKTTANRQYGHSRRGRPAVEVQRYTSDVNYTINLLHCARGVDHFNVLDGPSNGLEMIHFFEEAMEVTDEDGQPILIPGDTVVMDNCGFHHGRLAEPYLRQLLQERQVNLVFQPPYCPEFNTCELCFRSIKGYLRKHDIFAVEFTETAIIEAVSEITPQMSRNLFRCCGFPLF